MVLLAYFAAGLFLANAVPHFVNGVSGRDFQSPFAKPPGVGESPPVINVFWGLINFIIGLVLLFGVGEFQAGFTPDMLTLLLGFGGMAVFLSLYFGKVRNEQGNNKS